MGACGSKPKVLGDKLRREPRNLTSNTLQSFSSAGQPSFNDSNQPSLSFSAAPDDKAAITHDDKTSLSFTKSPDDPQQAPPMASQEEEDSNPNATVAIDNVAIQNDRSDELPSNHNGGGDDRDHDIRLEYTTEDETDVTIREDGQNGVVEGPKLKDEVAGPTPTDDEQDQIPNTPSAAIMDDGDDDDVEATSPAGLQPQTSPPPHNPQNDVVETLLTPPPAGVLEPQNDDAVAAADDEETSSSSENSPPNTEEKEKEKEKENGVVAEALRTSPPGLVTPVSSSPTAHHKSKEVLVFDHIPLIETAMLRESPSAAALLHHAGPTYHQHIAVRDHRVLQVANKAEVPTDDQRGNFVTSSNAMPSTFAF